MKRSWKRMNRYENIKVDQTMKIMTSFRQFSKQILSTRYVRQQSDVKFM